MTQPQTAPVHEIANDLLQAIRDGGQGEEAAVVDPKAIRGLEQKVDEHLGTVELFDVVETVLFCAQHLEMEFESPQAAETIMALVERQHVVDSMNRINVKVNAKRAEERAAAAAAGGEAFARFAERMQPKVAKAGKVPDDALQVAIAFPRRM